MKCGSSSDFFSAMVPFSDFPSSLVRLVLLLWSNVAFKLHHLKVCKLQCRKEFHLIVIELNSINNLSAWAVLFALSP